MILGTLVMLRYSLYSVITFLGTEWLMTFEAGLNAVCSVRRSNLVTGKHGTHLCK